MLLFKVLNLLCESKVNAMIKRYGQKIIHHYKENLMGVSFFEDHEIPSMVIERIIDRIDSSERYLEWIIKQYLNKMFVLVEDEYQVKEDIEAFDKHKRKMQYQDINRYSLASLRQELVKFAEHGDDGSFAEQIKTAIQNKDIVHIGEQNGINIFHTLTKEGNILLGRGGGHSQINKWCTSRPDDKNRFEQYNSTSDIYVWIFKDGRRFQCDVNRESQRVENWMNERDIDIVREKVDLNYWEQMRTTPFMVGIRDKALSIEFKVDEYNTSVYDVVKLCNIHDKRFMRFMGNIITTISLKQFNELLPELLNNLLKNPHPIFFLYDLEQFINYVHRNPELRDYNYSNDVSLDNRFSNRVYEIVQATKTSINQYEKLVQQIMNDNAIIGNLFDNAVRQRKRQNQSTSQ